MSRYQLEPRPKLGFPAAAAVVAVGCSYLLSCTGHGIWGLIAAIIGIISGILGLLWSAIPHRSGALLSIVAILLSVIALIPAILSMLGRLAMHL